MPKLPATLRSIKQFIIDSLPSQLSNDADGRKIGFPYNTPSATDYGPETSLFQETISDDEFLSSAKRNPYSSVIVNDVAEDVFDKGFYVMDLDARAEDKSGTTLSQDEIDKKDKNLTQQFNDHFDKFIKLPLMKSYKLARALGYSLILIGYDDDRPLTEPYEGMDGTQIKYLQPIPKLWIEEIKYKKDGDVAYIFPIQVEKYMMKSEVGTEFIHPSRVIHVENPSLSILLNGKSALESCYDDLDVIKHITWGAGQTLWRSGNQLLTAIAPPRATTAQITDIDDSLNDVSAKSHMTFPFGTDLKSHTPIGLNPGPYAKIPMNNISAATRIPISILVGSQAGAKVSAMTDARDYTGTLTGIQHNVIIPILTKIFWQYQLSGQLPYVKFKIEFENPLSVSQMDQSLIDYRTALTSKINFQNEKDRSSQPAQSTTPETTTIEEPGQYQILNEPVTTDPVTATQTETIPGQTPIPTLN